MLGRDDVLPTIRRKVCHCIAQVANALCYVEAEDGSTTQVPEQLGKEWAQLIPTIMEIATSQNNRTRELAYFAFSQMADYVGEGVRPYQQPACEFITAGLDDACADVRLAALRSMSAFLIVLESPAERGPFEALIPKQLQVISAALNDGEELGAREALQALLEIADVQPNFLRKNLVPVGEAMLTIAGTEDLDASTRQLGLEFLVTLAERSGGMMRKQMHLMKEAIPMAVTFICDVEEDEEWASREEPEGAFGDAQEGDELSAFGEQAIDRLSVALGGKAVMPVTTAIIEELLNNKDDWKQRRAAFQTLALMGEGCAKHLKPQIAAVVGMVLPSFEDPHPRVRYAAIHCVGQLAVDFAGELHRVAHKEVVAAIGAAMGELNAGCPRLQSHAASALINFCHPEYCEAPMITDHVQLLLENLFNLISTDTSVSVKTLAFTAVACVASVVEEDFSDEYYSIFMPLAKEVLNVDMGAEPKGSFAAQAHLRLRARAIECIGIIGNSVGKMRFADDAKAVMEMLLAAQAEGLSADDPQTQSIIQSCARVCQCLGHDFLPYMPLVLPPLLEGARMRGGEISVVDAEGAVPGQEEEEEEEGIDSVIVELRGIGLRKFSINTAALQEKVTACQMLIQYITNLGTSFMPCVHAGERKRAGWWWEREGAREL
jgi:hypothetical protein